MKKILVLIFALGFVGGTWWLALKFFAGRENIVWEKELSPVVTETRPIDLGEEPPEAEPELLPQETEIRTIIHRNVPFTVQAPHGTWSAVYEDACEEASILMVGSSHQGETLTKEAADKEILALAEYGKKTFGHFVDTSAKDTAKILEDNFGISSEVVYDMALEDVQRAVVEGHLLIVPAAGRKLKNPYFTPPGPVNHMLVITGYDAEQKEFVTNDPGTRHGEDYRYAQDILYSAIRDYPTGRHLPNPEERKAMIVVKVPQKP